MCFGFLDISFSVLQKMSCSSWSVARLFLAVTSILVCSFVLFCFLLYLSLLRRARPRCVIVFPQARDILSSPAWPSRAVRNIFRGILFPSVCIFLFLSFVPLLRSFRSLSFVFGLFQCVWVADVRVLCLLYPVRWRGIALYTPLQHYDVVSLCRSFVPTEPASLEN